MRTRLLRKLNRDIGKSSIYRVSKRIGLQYSTLFRIVRGQTAGSMPTWEKIAQFYGQK